MAKKKVVIAMSGGVDSSVAAALLKREGYDVSGVIMEIYDGSLAAVSPETPHHACFGPGENEDIADAREVAEKLGIPFYIVDLKEKYKKNILDFFVNEYLQGNTPNPCVKCNHEMKFCAIVEELKKREIQFDYFATGHYARIEYNENKKRFLLKKAADPDKDQSYFLYNLRREQLANLLFPLGNYKKTEVRKLAQELLPDLPVKDKPESQDFIAGGYHQLFVETQNPGPILNTQGQVIGRHKGIVFYTIGQRRNLDIPGNNGNHPLYVIAKDQERNAVIVGEKKDLMGSGFFVKNLNWLTFQRLNHSVHLKARIRSQHREAEARVTPMDVENKKVLVKFLEPQRAITPGQAVVFYDGDIVAGGGIIEEVIE